MNISNVNNNGGVNAGRPVNQPGENEAAETARRANGNAAPDTTQVRDTYQSTREREISAIAAQASRITNEPREAAVSQARDRVSQGYYNQRDVMQNVAIQLINTGRAS